MEADAGPVDVLTKRELEFIAARDSFYMASVSEDAALQAAWEAMTAHPEVVVDAAPGPIRSGSSTRHFLIFIPGGIRLEFATPFA